MLLLILGLILFIGLVVIHEFGHFIMARRNGVEIEEFGIGFPPRLYKHKTKGGWLFTINLLPLGGFVKLKGEHDSDTAPGTFGAASLSAKTKIMAAGVVMNFITALLLLTALSWVGTPLLVCNQYTVTSDTKYVGSNNDVSVSEVEAGSPASRIGLQKDDRLVAAGPSLQQMQQITPECALGDITKQNAGGPLTITYVRAGQTYTKQALLLSKTTVEASQNTNQPKGYLGIGTTKSGLRYARSTWSAPIVAIGQTVQFTKLTFQGLGRAVAGLGSLLAGAATGNSEARSNGQKKSSSQVSGPVGIFYILKDGSSLGLRFVLFIIAIISLTLAIMNILPIPALDGGRLWLTLLTRGIGKPISQEKEELINASGFVFLLLLIILITVVDVKRRM